MRSFSHQILTIFNTLSSPGTFQETSISLFAPWFLNCATANLGPLTLEGLLLYWLSRDLVSVRFWRWESKNGTQ